MERKCILIVEDETDIANVYREFFENAGFEVDLAKDGQEGLQKVTEGKADIMLLDVMMPKLDGIGVLQLIKEKGYRLPKTLLLTNLMHNKTLNEAVALGVSDCIVKSEVTPDALLEKVNHLLET